MRNPLRIWKQIDDRAGRRKRKAGESVMLTTTCNLCSSNNLKLLKVRKASVADPLQNQTCQNVPFSSHALDTIPSHIVATVLLS